MADVDRLEHTAKLIDGEMRRAFAKATDDNIAVVHALNATAGALSSIATEIAIAGKRSPSPAKAERLARCAAKIKDRWTDEGPRPGYHREQMRHLETYWPTMFVAISDLVDLVEETP